MQGWSVIRPGPSPPSLPQSVEVSLAVQFFLQIAFVSVVSYQ